MTALAGFSEIVRSYELRAISLLVDVGQAAASPRLCLVLGTLPQPWPITTEARRSGAKLAARRTLDGWRLAAALGGVTARRHDGRPSQQGLARIRDLLRMNKIVAKWY